MGVIVELPAIHVTGDNPGSLVGGHWSDAGPHLHLRLWESWERLQGDEAVGFVHENGEVQPRSTCCGAKLAKPI